MSTKVVVVVVILLLLSIGIAGVIVFSVQINTAMPNIAKTAEAITDATLTAGYKLTNPAPP